MRRLILSAFMGCAGLFAAVVPDGAGARRSAADLDAAHAAHSHGPAASALAASATAATLAASAATATPALATASAASASASTAFAASGASTLPGRPASAGHPATWAPPRPQPRLPGLPRAARLSHRGGPAFGTGSQRSRYEDALLRRAARRLAVAR